MGKLRQVIGSALLAGTLVAAATTPAAAKAVGPVTLFFYSHGWGATKILATNAATSMMYNEITKVGFTFQQCYDGRESFRKIPLGYEAYLRNTCSGDARPAEKTFNLYRYYNGSDHVSSTWGMPSTYDREGSLGRLYTAPHSGTEPLYECKIGDDRFTSEHVDCEGYTYGTRLGWIYPRKPSGVATRPVYRCRTNRAQEHFDANHKGCEGQHRDGLLGYALK